MQSESENISGWRVGGEGIREMGSHGDGYPCSCYQRLFFLGPHQWHMEVPRLGVELELKLPASTAPHGNTRSLTH